MVATAGSLLLGGRAADLLGRRRIFASGLALFAAASLAGGLAQTSVILLVARAGQGRDTTSARRPTGAWV